MLNVFYDTCSIVLNLVSPDTKLENPYEHPTSYILFVRIILLLTFNYRRSSNHSEYDVENHNIFAIMCNFSSCFHKVILLIYMEWLHFFYMIKSMNLLTIEMDASSWNTSFWFILEIRLLSNYIFNLKIYLLVFTFLVHLKQDEVVARIEERIAAWTFLPSGNLIILLHILIDYTLNWIESHFLFVIPLSEPDIQKMVKLYKYCIMSMVKSMSLILITFMIRPIKNWVVIEWLQCSCIYQMLRRVERRCSLVPR